MLLAGALALAVVALAANALVLAARPYRVQVSLDGVTAALTPDAEITVATTGLGGEIESVALQELALDADGQVISERSVPVSLAPVQEEAGWRRARLQQTDGSVPLRYDATYRLRLDIRSKAPTFPLPTDVHSSREYSFATLPTPRLEAPSGLLSLRYAEPIATRWSAPIEELEAEATPAVRLETSVDPTDRRIGYVRLVDPAPGARYEVRIVRARGANGAPLLSPSSITVETAAPPAPLVGEAKLVDGRLIELRWDGPVQSFDYEITPPVASAVRIDEADRRASYIELREPQQDQRYTVAIKGAVGTNGAPLTSPAELEVVTPPALEVVSHTPVAGAFGVDLRSPIEIAFGEPVRDRAAAEQAIVIAPAIPGWFEWADDARVTFVPEGGLPELTDVTVTVRGGPEGVRSARDGFLESPFEFRFLTRPNKVIDVDLTRQRITLYEGDRPVFTAPAATGVRGAETPTGRFLVDYKLPSARFQGVNPSGSRYDIPNVPWVLSFLGNYTIHGSPWRTQFGYPQSNGCVSLETGVAKHVYDWAPVGTPVTIHY